MQNQITSELLAMAAAVRPLGNAAVDYDAATQHGSVRVTEPVAAQHYFTPAERAARATRVLRLLAGAR